MKIALSRTSLSGLSGSKDTLLFRYFSMKEGKSEKIAIISYQLISFCMKYENRGIYIYINPLAELN